MGIHLAALPRLTSPYFSGVFGSVSEVDLPVDAGNFRLINRKIRDQLLQLGEVEPYLRGLVRWVGFRQEPVYYEREARFAGDCHVPLFGVGPAKEFMAGLTTFSVAPIFLIFVFGFVATVLSLGALAVIVLGGVAGGFSGSAAMTAFLVFLWGSLMFAIGFVGVYVARVYKDVRGRPRYIVRDTIGFGD